MGRRKGDWVEEGWKKEEAGVEALVSGGRREEGEYVAGQVGLCVCVCVCVCVCARLCARTQYHIKH